MRTTNINFSVTFCLFRRACSFMQNPTIIYAKNDIGERYRKAILCIGTNIKIFGIFSSSIVIVAVVLCLFFSNMSEKCKFVLQNSPFFDKTIDKTSVFAYNYSIYYNNRWLFYLMVFYLSFEIFLRMIFVAHIIFLKSWFSDF